MRFHNLTITMTLACLSIVAIAALALLPITNGVCESGFYASDWTYSNDNTQASYSARHYGSHWSLSGSVDARGVDASVSVSPFELPDWTEADRLEGTATVTAIRGDSSVRSTYYHDDYHTCDNWFLACWGHDIIKIIEGSGETNTNERAPDASQSDSLILDVQFTTHTATKAAAWSKKEGREVEITLGLDLPESQIPIEKGAKGTYKTETLKSTSQSYQVTGIKKAYVADQVGRGANVSRFSSFTGSNVYDHGATAASTDFSFYEASSNASVYD